MDRRTVSMLLLSFLVLATWIQTANAAAITSASLDSTSYVAGQTGYISVTIYNDKNEKIRVTELTATIDYYYTDGTVYVQKFFSSDILPDEILAGQSGIYEIPISLPTNIAHGYTNPLIEARTEIWSTQVEHWFTSDRPTYRLRLYIESPYKQLYQGSQEELQNTQQLLQDQKATNEGLTNTVNMLALIVVVFAAAAAAMMFVFFTRKRALPAQQ